ncbi:MAG: hypothetical protein ACRDS0_32720, partial [Pseudonocardiaceae bacterium]
STPTGATTSTRNTTASTTPDTATATNSQHDHVTPEEPHPNEKRAPGVDRQPLTRIRIVALELVLSMLPMFCRSGA